MRVPTRANVLRLISLVGSGKVGFRQALKRGQSRLGRRVLSQRRPSFPQSEKVIARALEAHEAKIRQLSGQKKPPKALAAWQARAAILRRMRGLGFRPHATNLAAAMAIEFGLEKKRLLPLLNSLINIDKSYARGALFEGTIENIATVVRADLPFQIHKLLTRTTKALSPEEITTALKLGGTKRSTLAKIIHSFAVLDLMGLTQKLPTEGSTFRWVHSLHRHTPATIPNWNVDWQVLQSLRDGPKKTSELSLPRRLPKGKTIGSKRGIASMQRISSSYLRLGQTGLVQIIKIPSLNGYEARLTKYGRQLLQRQDKAGYLIEELRTAFLGLPRQPNQPGLLEQRMISKMIKWGKVSLALKKERERLNVGPENPHAGVIQTARKLKIASGVVGAITRGSIPWKRVKKETLMVFYLPHIAKRHPKIAAHLRQIISSLE